MPKTFMTKQLIQKIRKLTIGQGKNYTTGCSLDYEYIKNHCRIIAVELSGREKELAADPKKKKSTNMIFWTIKKTR